MRFIADNTVGRLRRWLCLLGYDVVYDPRSAREILHALREEENAAWRGERTVETAAEGTGEERTAPQRIVVLGRCPTLAMEEGVMAREMGAPHGARIDATETIPAEMIPVGPSSLVSFHHIPSPRLAEQIARVVHVFPLDFRKTMFTRCSCCNAELVGPLPLRDVAAKVPPIVQEWRTEYYRCPRCERVYWDGTHTEHVRDFLRDALPPPADSDVPEP
jgi:uncharacterized protein with PIN domain